MRKRVFAILLAVLACAASALQAQTSLLDPASFTSLAGYFNPGGNVTVNMGTNQMTVSGGSTYTGVVSGSTLVFTFDSVNVGSSITITFAGVASLGNKFALLSKGKMNIAGTINAYGSAGLPGPGGGVGAFGNRMVNANGAGPGGGYGETAADNGCSGGGAFGGNGGLGNGQPHQALAYGDLAATLQAGSGGGHGYYADSGYAGGGGGAVELGARSATMTLQSTCQIYAYGANGWNSITSGWDGTGGGSGGGVLIHSYNISIASGAVINANGGAGGNGNGGGWGAGGAGGGRVSIYYHSSGSGTNLGTVSVTGGAAGIGDPTYPATAGSPGVIVFNGSTSAALGGMPPSAPVANAASAITEHSFTANWDTVAGATKYYFDAATDSGFTAFVTGYNNLDAGPADSCVVSGLDYSTTYYYRVRAYNANGASGNSNIISVTTLDNQGPVIVIKAQPSSPQNTAGPYTVQAVITDPAKKGAKSIAADSLYYRVSGGSWAGLGTVSVVGDTFDFHIPAIDTGTVEYYLQAWDDVDSTTLEPPSTYYSFLVDTVPPSIVLTSPADGDSGVALDAPIMFVFSEPIDTASLAGSMTPSPNEQPTWNATLDTMTLVHDLLALNTTYTVEITGANDLSGNPLAVLPDSLVFTTKADTSHPYLVWTSPVDSQSNVSPAASVALAFSEPMDQMSLGFNIFPNPGGGISLNWSATGDTAIFSTGNPFALAAVETIQVVSALDLFGNPLVTGLVPSTFTFTITSDTVAPYIISTSPGDGATDVALNEPIVIAFSEPMNTGSVDGYPSPNHNFTLSWNAAGDTMTMTPDTLYDYATVMSVIATAGTDTSGNSLVNLPDTFITFTTIDNQLPAITVLQQPASTFDGAGPFDITAVMTDPGKKAKVGVISNQLYWQASNEYTWHSLAASVTSGDTCTYSIPGPVAAGLVINAYVEAVDDANDTTNSDLIQFQILNPLAPAGLAATTGQDGTVPLSWTAPAESLYYYSPTTVYAFNMPANSIVSTRYTPGNYPCRIDQIRSSWNTTYGTAAMHFRIYGDDGHGFPDEGNVIFDTTYTPAAGTWADLLNLSANNLVIASGDFHVSWEVLTYQYPRPRGTQDGGIQQRSLYKWTDGNWYADVGGDWLNRVAVSYSNYSKGAGLKTAALTGNDPRFDRVNKEVLKPVTDKVAKQSASLPAFDLIKNIGDYQVYRSTVSGGPYSFVASATGLSYDDNSVTNDTTYYYVVQATYDWALHADTFSAWSNEASATPLGVAGQPGAVSYSFYLMPASPNPVKGSAEFRFGLAKGAQASLGIYNVLGQRVKTLVSGNLAAGNHTVKWNGCDNNGRKVSSGVYVYRLTTGENTSTRRFTVIR